MTDLHQNIVRTHTESDEHNGITQWTEKITDPNGNLLSKRVDEYSYYPTGEIDTITLKTFSGQHLISTKTIKHFRDATKPLATIKLQDHP